jgi:hypothetical protein
MEKPKDSTLSTIESLLDTRQLELIASLNEFARQGDQKMTQILREEIDFTSRMLQTIRSKKITRAWK